MQNDEYEYEGEESLSEPDLPEECFDPDTGEYDEKRAIEYFSRTKIIEKKKITIDKDDNITIEKTTTTNKPKEVGIEEIKKGIKLVDKSDVGCVHNRESILIHLDLSKDNFIMKYIETMRQMTSSYAEYHFAMAVSILSIISDRRLKLSMRHKIIYPNIWLFLLGLSTVSQKSTAFDLGEEVINKLSVETRIPELVKNKLPGYFSPEGFGKALRECQGHGYEWKDESGELLKTMEKEYMSNMRDFLCDLYGCKEFYRKLAKSDILVNNPFVNMVLATTPDTFREYTKLTDLTSGWLYRFIYVYPKYDKSYMSIGKRTSKDNDKIKDLVLLLAKKVDFISKIKNANEIEFGFESGSLEFYEKWSERMYYKAQSGKDEIEAAIIGRLEDYVLKLAILFTFGEPIVKLEISNKIMKMTCQIVEDYFLPTTIGIAKMVAMDEKHNIVDKVLGAITRFGNDGVITRSKLMNHTHIRKRDLDDVLETLEEGDEIKIEGESRKKTIRLIIKDKR